MIARMFLRFIDWLTKSYVGDRPDHRPAPRPDIVFRPGDVRDTAAAMIPPEED